MLKITDLGIKSISEWNMVYAHSILDKAIYDVIDRNAMIPLIQEQENVKDTYFDRDAMKFEIPEPLCIDLAGIPLTDKAFNILTRGYERMLFLVDLVDYSRNKVCLSNNQIKQFERDAYRDGRVIPFMLTESLEDTLTFIQDIKEPEDFILSDSFNMKSLSRYNLYCLGLILVSQSVVVHIDMGDNNQKALIMDALRVVKEGIDTIEDEAPRDISEIFKNGTLRRVS